VSLGIGVVAGPRYADEHLGLADLAAVRVDDGHRLTGIVHKEFLPTLVGESHQGL